MAELEAGAMKADSLSGKKNNEMSLLTKNNLEIYRLASKEASRFALHGVCVTPESTVATDGHLLCEVGTSPLKAESYPAIPNMPAATDDWKPFVLPAEGAARLLRDMPKRTTLPVLRCVAVLAEGGNSGAATAVTTDLERASPVIVRRDGASFPDYRRVLDGAVQAGEKTEFAAAYNAAALADLFAYIAKASGAKRGMEKPPKCLLRFGCAKSAMRVESQTAEGEPITALVMPADQSSAVDTTAGLIRRMERAGEPDSERKQTVADATERLVKLKAQVEQLDRLLRKAAQAAA
jgi:hypothetical protein